METQRTERILDCLRHKKKVMKTQYKWEMTESRGPAEMTRLGSRQREKTEARDEGKPKGDPETWSLKIMENKVRRGLFGQEATYWRLAGMLEEATERVHRNHEPVQPWPQKGSGHMPAETGLQQSHHFVR